MVEGESHLDLQPLPSSPRQAKVFYEATIALSLSHTHTSHTLTHIPRSKHSKAHSRLGYVISELHFINVFDFNN